MVLLTLFLFGRRCGYFVAVVVSYCIDTVAAIAAVVVAVAADLPAGPDPGVVVPLCVVALAGSHHLPEEADGGAPGTHALIVALLLLMQKYQLKIGKC